MTFYFTVVKFYLLDPQDSIKPVPSLAEPQLSPKAKPQLSPKAKPQLLPKQGKGRPHKYPLFMAVIDIAIIDTMKDINAFTNDTADMANITIYLQGNSNTQFSAL